MHRAVFDRDQNTVTLAVADVGTLVAAGLQKLRPAAGRARRGGARPGRHRRARHRQRQRHGRSRAPTTSGCSHWLLSLVGRRAGRRRARALAGPSSHGRAARRSAPPWPRRAGRRAAASAARSPSTRSTAPTRAAAVGAVWDAFLGDLRTAAWILAGSGAVVAAAAASLIRPVDARAPLRRAAAAGSPPSRSGRRSAMRASPSSRPVSCVLRRHGRDPAPARDARRPLSHLRRRQRDPAGSCTSRAGAAPAARGQGRARAPARGGGGRRRARRSCSSSAPRACSSARAARRPPRRPRARATATRALCDRPLTDVALPATHNSMSVPLPGWFSALQDAPIADQLHDGIRGLLIDTHYADRLDERPAAHGRRSPDELRRQAAQDGVSPERRRRRAAPARTARLRGRGQARDVPLPLVLRARRHAPSRRARRPARLPRRQPGRGGRRDQPGLRDARRTSSARSKTPASTSSPTAGRRRAAGRRCAR